MLASIFIIILILKHKSASQPMIALCISKAAMTIHFASSPLAYAGIFTQLYCLSKIYRVLTPLGKHRTLKPLFYILFCFELWHVFY